MEQATSVQAGTREGVGLNKSWHDRSRKLTNVGLQDSSIYASVNQITVDCWNLFSESLGFTD